MHTLTRCSCLCLCLLHAESLCYIAFRFMATLTVCVCVCAVCLLLAAPGCRPHAAADAAALYPTLPALDIQGLLLALLLFCSAHRVLQQHREEKKLVSISVLQLYVTQLRLLLLKTVLCCVCVSLAYTYDASAFCYLLFFAKMTQTHMYTHTHTQSPGDPETIVVVRYNEKHGAHSAFFVCSQWNCDGSDGKKWAPERSAGPG